MRFVHGDAITSGAGQAIMFCTNCGKSVSDTAAQCEYCGASLVASRQARAVSEAQPTGAAPSAPEDTDQHRVPTKMMPPPAGDSMTGRVLGGRYQLDSCIGTGGMGAIYKARRLHIGDTVAVKILRPEVVNDALQRERFHREARAAAMLNHPNAVVIHDFGEDADGTAYIVMELLEGQSLRQILAAERTIQPERAYGIIRQACAALEAAHRRGIIHRDIKPDNIILTDSHDLTDHVKLLDFGIAKLRDKAVDTASLEKSLTTVGTVIGTPHYMSPEQCQGESADARSDIYSMGVVIYEMLAGVVPFTAKTPTGVAVKHVTETPKRISAVRQEITGSIEQVVMRALSKNPADRQQSALELARQYEAAIQAGVNTGAAETTALKATSVPTSSISQTAETNVNPAVNAINNRSFETQVSRAKAGGLRPLPIVTAIVGLLVILAVAAGTIWVVRNKTAKNISSPTPETASPTPAVIVEASPPPSATPAPPVAPEGMVYVPGGEFRLGRDDGDDYERPAHPVKVSPFFIDVTEVTNEAYQKFVDANGYLPPPSWKDGKFPAGSEKLPVTDVSWEDANAYAKWAGKRLPTEEEWEFAARGTDNRLYPWGIDWKPGFSNITESGGGKKKLAPVGSFAQGVSPFNTLDMSGNAWEWTASDLKAYPGGNLKVPDEYAKSTLKVIRGGSFSVPPERATATVRRGWPASREDWPEGANPDYSQTGFRCAQDAP